MNDEDPISYFEPRSIDLPMVGMGDRRFELFVAGLLRADDKSERDYDAVSLRLQGSDEGQDIVLYQRGERRAVVQCKCLKDRIGATQVVEELAKYAMFQLRVQSAVMAPMRYELWLASDLTGAARLLFDEAAHHLPTALSDLASVVEKLRTKYKRLATTPVWLTPDEEVENVRRIIIGLELRAVVGLEINDLAFRHPIVRRMHFRGPDDPGVDPAEIETLLIQHRRTQLDEYRREGRAGDAPYVAIGGVAWLFERFLVGPHRALAVVADRGHGKSTWIARVLENPPEGVFPVVVTASSIISGDLDLPATLARIAVAGHVPNSGDAIFAVRSWLRSTPVLVMIDGLDRCLSGMRETLGDWLRTSIGAFEGPGAKLVVTSRPEFWSTIHNELPQNAFHPISMNEINEDSNDHAEHRMVLEWEDVRNLYAAYGLDLIRHGARPLRTPSLISAYAKVQHKIAGPPTRTQIFKSFVEEMASDVERRAGIGRTARDLAFRALSSQLLASADGALSTGDLANALGAHVVDALVEAGVLARSGDVLRPVLDEVLEFLIAQAIPKDADPLALLARGPVHGNAVALRIALDQETDAHAGEALLDLLLEGEPDRRRFDLAARILLECRGHVAQVARARRLFGLWRRANFLLVTSPAGELVHDLRLPADSHLDVIMDLAQGEEDHDWRDRYWELLPQQGRTITPFAAAATRLSKELGAAALHVLARHVNDASPVPHVVRGLAVEAARADMAEVIAVLATWSSDVGRQSLSMIVQAEPDGAARAIVDLTLAERLPTCLATSLLYQMSQNTHYRWPTEVAASASRELLSLNLSPELRAKMLICALRGQTDAALVRELLDLQNVLEPDEAWPAIEALGEQAGALLDRVVRESGEGGAWDHVLSYAGGWNFGEGTALRLLERLSMIDASAPHARSRALAIEACFGAIERSNPLALERWLPMAAQLARHADPDVRRPIIYYAASLCRMEVGELSRARIAIRSALVSELLAAEDGGTLRLLAEKIVESAPERSDALGQLRALSDRFGQERLLGAMDMMFDLYPAGPTLRAALQQRGLLDEGRKPKG
ncbi:MAG: hypothetical protein EOS17_14165 [Mesorhizobium sp.]|nr:MAG: hypothetical protein EOS17_14165 [Mesorhizobium sp.]